MSTFTHGDRVRLVVSDPDPSTFDGRFDGLEATYCYPIKGSDGESIVQLSIMDASNARIMDLCDDGGGVNVPDEWLRPIETPAADMSDADYAAYLARVTA